MSSVAPCGATATTTARPSTCGGRTVHARGSEHAQRRDRGQRREDLDPAVDVMIPLKRTDERICEYACHEGNLGMIGILSGHRALEEDAGGKGSR